MDKENVNINLGLTKEELELLVKNSNNPDVLKEYEEKLENCDLSKSAIELIDEDNLGAIGRITNSINNKYPAPQGNKLSNGVIVGIIGAGLLIIGGILLIPNGSTIKEVPNTKTNIISTPINTNSNQSFEENEEIDKTDIETPVEDSESISNIEEENNSEINNAESNEISKKDTVIDKESEKNQTPEKTVSKEDEIKRNTHKQEKIEFVAVKEERQVRNITVSEDIDQKFKDVQYSLEELVSYSGGKEALGRNLFEQLKNKVKDTDVPKRNSSIVFKFNVSSKGKVRDVNVLSVVSPELEQIIQQTTLNLSNWNKGKKRIPRDYTVYVTFK